MNKKNCLVIPNIDEFNYLSSINNFVKDLKKEYQNVYTFSMDGMEILYNDFDKIFIKNEKNKENNVLDELDSKPESERMKFRNNLLKPIIKHITKEEKNIHILDYRNFDYQNKHIYEFVFSNLTRRLLEKDENVHILPFKKDYEDIKKSLEKINKKIITISGRNLNKIPDKNQTFKNIIEFLLKYNFFVINCTINPPNFNFNSNSYLEIKDSNLPYSKNISYFLNSNCVISIANAGGVSNHLLTKANFILLGYGGWVDNPKFGFNGQSIVSARKKNENLSTKHFVEFNGNMILEAISNIEKPNVKDFFDKSKVISI